MITGFDDAPFECHWKAFWNCGSHVIEYITILLGSEWSLNLLYYSAILFYNFWGGQNYQSVTLWKEQHLNSKKERDQETAKNKISDTKANNFNKQCPYMASPPSDFCHVPYSGICELFHNLIYLNSLTHPTLSEVWTYLSIRHCHAFTYHVLKALKATVFSSHPEPTA